MPFIIYFRGNKGGGDLQIMEKSVGTVSYTHMQFVTPSPPFNVEKDIMYSVLFKSITTLHGGEEGRVNHFYTCLFSTETQEM